MLYTVDYVQIVEINLGCTDHDVEHTYRLLIFFLFLLIFPFLNQCCLKFK